MLSSIINSNGRSKPSQNVQGTGTSPYNIIRLVYHVSYRSLMSCAFWKLGLYVICPLCTACEMWRIQKLRQATHVYSIYNRTEGSDSVRQIGGQSLSTVTNPSHRVDNSVQQDDKVVFKFILIQTEFLPPPSDRGHLYTSAHMD